jgi:hypothetical protein
MVETAPLIGVDPITRNVTLLAEQCVLAKLHDIPRMVKQAWPLHCLFTERESG